MATISCLGLLLCFTAYINGRTLSSRSVQHHHSYYGSVHNYGGLTSYDKSRDENRQCTPDDNDDDRTYYFQVYLSSQLGHAYLNDEGRMQGFFPDLVLEVCRRAGKKCFWVHDTFTNCWRTDDEGNEFPGRGLMDRWVDACVGFLPSALRSNSFNFSTPYSNPIQAALKFGSELAVTDNLTGLKIGFVTGWAFNPTCMAHNTNLSGNQKGEYSAVFYKDEQVLEEVLSKGEVDAVLKYYGLQKIPKDEQALYGTPFPCGSGYCVMARYGDDVISWWNEAFDKMYHSGAFRKFCERERKIHGTRGNINCLDA